VKKELYCIICGTKIPYIFGRPRKACDNPECQKILQKLRVKRFKLKRKKFKGEALQAVLAATSLKNYEPTIYNTDLGNIFNLSQHGIFLKVIPEYNGSSTYRAPMKLTIEFIKDSIEFYKNHPKLVKHPEKLQPNPKPHRIGAGSINFVCEVCGSSKIGLKPEGGWMCLECGSDFSLPIYWIPILR
jgi:predicted nucleic acid-binding Zn ribbon protein